MTADVRVVVVTYNSEGFLGPFLDSVAESSQREIAVTVSDNGSRDGSLAIAEGRFADWAAETKSRLAAKGD